jgi:hypothetical protein
MILSHAIFIVNSQSYVNGKRHSVMGPSHSLNGDAHWYIDNQEVDADAGRAFVNLSYEHLLEGLDSYLPIACNGVSYFQCHPLQYIVRSYL